MPELKLTFGNYGRSRVNLPQVRLVNAYVEPSRGGPSEAIRTTRPGLTLEYTNGTEPVLAMYQNPGLFGGDLFTICGSSFYRNDTLVGTIAYSQFPQMAAGDGLLVIVSGGALYKYDGTNLTSQLYFDDGVSLLPQFSGVSVQFSFFIYPVVNSQQFFFSNVGDPTTINGLSFSEVEVYPDNIIQSYVLADQLYFFKNTSTEIWNFTGDSGSPFQLQQGSTYARGCVSQNSVRKLDNALFWVGDDFIVYRTATVPTRVSTSFIEDRIRSNFANNSDITSFTYDLEGHVVYVINLPGTNESYAYDVQTQEWSHFGTLNGLTSDVNIFIGSYAAGQGGNIYVGSSVDGRIWMFDVNNMTDDGIKIQVIVSGAIWFDEGRQRCNNVVLEMVRGVATSSTPDPIVELRYSDDAGRTWSSWLEGSLGYIGTYKYKTSWHSLGLMQPPGRLFEFRIADSVNVTIEGAAYNVSRM